METVTKTVIYAVLQIPRKSELGSVGSKVAKAKKKGFVFIITKVELFMCH